MIHQIRKRLEAEIKDTWNVSYKNGLANAVEIVQEVAKEYGKDTNVRSNADHIRSMSDEELAEWIHKHDESVQDFGRMSKTETLQWLKSEVKE